MTSSVSPSHHVPPKAALSDAQYAASRHAVWLSAAAIVTDQVGRVLLVNPTYREDDRWLLPGGAAEPGEHPLNACRREIAEELGLQDLALPDVLAIHSLSPHHPDIKPGMPCPGEIRYIFDGGTLTPDEVQAIRLPPKELSEFAFFETRDAVQRLLPVDGQIMLAAYRARLADGRHILDVPALDSHAVHVRYRPMWDSPLNRTPVPGQLPVQQAWAWCFVPDGRVVLVADPGPRGSLPMLPGGTVEKADSTPEDTLHREAAEEAQLTLTEPVRLGWVLDETGEVYGGVGPNARLPWPPGSPPSGRRPSTPPLAAPSHACSPLPPRQPPCWAGARPERGKPSSRWRQHGSGGACPALAPPPSRRSPRRGCS
ncbi:NUDIX hydrolase [Streptomyces sp. NPDC048430]|uniref:NUDIX hydrolase n=1 Tax=Streptomyces sp. NPDC048430 TaxID=3155388 RepID=UPI00342DE265